MTEELNILGKTLKISASGGGVSEDLSGALIELSATVTAGKKLLAQKLTEKGADIEYTDSFAQMADAIDGDGYAVEPNFPIMIYPEASSATSGSAFSGTKMNDVYGKFDNDIRLLKEPTAVPEAQTSYSFTSYTPSQIISAMTTQDEGISTNTSYYDIKPYFNGNNFAYKALYLGGNCIINVNINEDFSLGDVEGKLCKDENGNTIQTANSTPIILAANADGSLAVAYVPKSGGLLKINTLSGIYEPLTIPALSNISQFVSDKKYWKILSGSRSVYSYRENTLIVDWNWDNLPQSSVYSGGFRFRECNIFGRYNGKIYFAQYHDGEIELSVFDEISKSFSNKIIPFKSLVNFSFTNFGSSNFGECLAFGPVPGKETYTVMHFGNGYLVFDENGNIVPYIKDSSLICALSKYGSTSAASFSSSAAAGFYKDGKFARMWDNSSSLSISPFDIKFSKVLAIVRHINEKESIFKNSVIITAENIEDGSFDCETSVMNISTAEGGGE